MKTNRDQKKTYEDLKWSDVDLNERNVNHRLLVQGIKRYKNQPRCNLPKCFEYFNLTKASVYWKFCDPYGKLYRVKDYQASQLPVFFAATGYACSLCSIYNLSASCKVFFYVGIIEENLTIYFWNTLWNKVKI